MTVQQTPSEGAFAAVKQLCSEDTAAENPLWALFGAADLIVVWRVRTDSHIVMIGRFPEPVTP